MPSNIQTLPSPSTLPSALSSNDSTFSVVRDFENSDARLLHTCETSFVGELRTTFRKLVQHWLFVALLAAHLYTIPLIYICQKVVHPSEKELIPSFSLLRRARCYMRFLDKRAEEGLVQTFHNLKTKLIAPFRTMHTLWRLAQFIEQNPDVLVCQSKTQQLHQSSVAITPSNQTPLNSPASASQVYHAALINGNTLDNLLSSFDPSQQQQLAVHTGALQISANDQMVRKRPKYRNSSIQVTPEEMMSPRKVSAVYDRSELFEVMKNDAELRKPSDVTVIDDSPLNIIGTSGQDATTIHRTQQVENIREVQMNEKRPTVQGKRCSVYERKHCQPYTSGPKNNLERSNIPIVEQRASMIPRMGSMPSKPVKLQRKVQ